MLKTPDKKAPQGKIWEFLHFEFKTGHSQGIFYKIRALFFGFQNRAGKASPLPLPPLVAHLPRTPPQSLKVGLQDPLQSLKVEPPRLRYSLINSFFSLICFFSSFLNNKQNSRPYLVSYAVSGESICGLRKKTYMRKSLNVRNRKSRNIPSFLLSYSWLKISKLVATRHSQILRQILPNLRFK